MRCWKSLGALICATILAACGGGGGSSGNGPETPNPPAAAAAPTIVLALTDANGVVVTSNSIRGGATFFVQASLRDGGNLPLSNRLVTFSTDASLATLVPATALTDSNGIARVQIAAIGAGAGNLRAVAQVGSVSVEGIIAFQTTPAKITFGALSAAQSTLATLQSTDVTARVLVNSIPAAAGEINVAFSAGCGTFSPATATTAAGGVARSTYTPGAGCSGSVNLTANAPGAIAISTAVDVAASVPASVRFVSVSEPLLVLSSSSSGATTSLVTFQVRDAVGAGIGGQNLTLALDTRSVQFGVTFSVNGVGNSAPQSLVSDANGMVQAVVRSGSVPTPVVVTASLASSPSVRASSSGLSITTGRAAQSRISLAASSLAIEAASGLTTTDGVISSLTMRIADRLGNPIPNGTAINFVSSAGRVDGACFTADSMCAVNFVTLAQRPASGLVTVLGYLDGEEDFTDTNGDNVWNPGEEFGDRGRLYLDLNANRTYEPSDQLIADLAPGDKDCLGTATTVANTCDKTWSGASRVSTSVQIAWSSSNVTISEVSRSSSNLIVRISDDKNNNAPVGSAIGVTGCAATVSPATIPNSTSPTTAVVSFAPPTAACTLRVTVTSPKGVVSSLPPISLP